MKITVAMLVHWNWELLVNIQAKVVIVWSVKVFMGTNFLMLTPQILFVMALEIGKGRTLLFLLGFLFPHNVVKGRKACVWSIMQGRLFL